MVGDDTERFMDIFSEVHFGRKKGCAFKNLND
jgi:hypothetical protein